MKNSQKGFIFPLLITIIALVAVGGVAYMYSEHSAASKPAPVSAAPAAQSDNEAIIQGIVNAKAILSSGNAAKIRAYLQAEYADNPKFEAQTTSESDTALLATAAVLTKAMSGIDATFLRTQCTFAITATTATCSWKPAPNRADMTASTSVDFTESITIKKINGVWQ